MDKGFPPVRLDFQDPNLTKLADIASKDEVDVSEALRVIANVLISMEGYTLRELRGQMASINAWRVTFADDFSIFKKGIEETRNERQALELEQAQLIVNRSTKLTTSQKIEQKLAQRGINWGAMWREKIVPGMLTALSIAIMFAIVQVWVVPILQKAAGTP